MIKKGFTLAETLITLMVIGVVAALTIPTLMQVYKDKQLETAAKKAMTTIGNGFKLMIAENDGSTEELPMTKCGEDFSCLSGVFHKSFQIGTDKSKTHEGFAESYTKHDSDEEAGFKWDDVNYIFTTNDGMTYGYLGGFGVVVDLNGEKGPNKICEDVIKLTYENGTVKNKQDNSGIDLCEDLDNPNEADCGSIVRNLDSGHVSFNGADANSEECQANFLTACNEYCASLRDDNCEYYCENDGAGNYYCEAGECN